MATAGIATKPINKGYDTRALAIAQRLLDYTGAERVILFGSRSRDDWRDGSDVDVLVIHPDAAELSSHEPTRNAARSFAKEQLGPKTEIDLVFSSPENYRHNIRTINHVSAIAHREGIAMPGNSEPHDGEPEEPDAAHENEVRYLRIHDANAHYGAMQALLDTNLPPEMAIQHAHMTLEHALKALMSAQGRQYQHIHNLVVLLDDVNRGRPEPPLALGSDLAKLNDYAVRFRYVAAKDPITDLDGMANNVTDDIAQIYRRIADVAGENPLSGPPPGENTAGIRLRYR